MGDQSADLDALAKEHWRGDHDEHEPPHLVWWDSTKDAWLDGFETGYRAALAALNDGPGGGEDARLLRRLPWVPREPVHQLPVPTGSGRERRWRLLVRQAPGRRWRCRSRAACRARSRSAPWSSTLIDGSTDV